MSPEGQPQAQPAQGSVAGSGRVRRGLSRMLECYLNDVEYLMRERLWTEAVPLALALPYICTALTDRHMRSSADQYLDWCHDWVRPPLEDTALSVVAPDDILAMAQVSGSDSTTLVDGVPEPQLRQLRLRRLTRLAPSRRRSLMTELVRADAAGEADREASIAIVSAVRRWYRERAAADATVQGNLGILALLR